MLQHLIKYRFFRSIICQVVPYRRLKTKENFKLLGLKVVAVASNERWPHTRSSKYSDLTGKPLVFWRIGGRNRRFDCIFVVDNKVKRDWLRDRAPWASPP